MRVEVDNAKCIRCGVCSSLMPAAFQLEGLDRVKVIKGDNIQVEFLSDIVVNQDEALSDIGRAATCALVCPTEAIEIIEK